VVVFKIAGVQDSSGSAKRDQAVSEGLARDGCEQQAKSQVIRASLGIYPGNEVENAQNWGDIGEKDGNDRKIRVASPAVFSRALFPVPPGTRTGWVHKACQSPANGKSLIKP
jgi:hypothetical protein